MFKIHSRPPMLFPRSRHAALALAILASCSLIALPAEAKRPVCGNGVVEGAELCDGSNLAGQTCESLGFSGGTLACSGCTFDTSACVAGASCGNGLVEGYEECDAPADANCPGQCSAHCACPATTPSASLEIHVIDVGQGDSILVISPDGYVMLIDSGIAGARSAVNAYLESVWIYDLDYTLVSHMHADHLGAMDLLLGDYPGVVACFDHGGTYASTDTTEYLAAAGARRKTLVAGDTIDMGPSLQVDVLHSHMGASADDENNNSVVVRITYGDLAFLLGGDCEAACEATFDPGLLEVYKVHHHGSRTATSELLMGRMQPYTALISLGVDDPYGYPHQEVLDRLAAYGTSVFRTDLDGSLVVRASDTSYTVNGASVCTNGQTRPCGLTDVGACEYGLISCVGGLWTNCQGAVDPVAEVCDNLLDDDCDGLTDDQDPDCSPAPGGLLIAQVGYDTPGDETKEEFVDLYNPTGSPVSLDGWTLTDNYSSWNFPLGIVILPSAYLSVARDATGFQTLYGKQPDVAGLTLALGNTGDRLVLGDGATEADFVAWEGYASGWTLAAGEGASLERLDPTVDSDTSADWTVTSPAAPRGGFEVVCKASSEACSVNAECCSGTCRKGVCK